MTILFGGNKPYFSDEEIAEMCRPLTQSAAQIRFLKRMGVRVRGRRPDGTPLVLRSDVESAERNMQREDEPNWTR